ncbi:hypothetical protein T492DRAFT_1140470, partial [Pavlovales sp. CCMP2436]
MAPEPPMASLQKPSAPKPWHKRLHAGQPAVGGGRRLPQPHSGVQLPPGLVTAGKAQPPPVRPRHATGDSQPPCPLAAPDVALQGAQSQAVSLAPLFFRPSCGGQAVPRSAAMRSTNLRNADAGVSHNMSSRPPRVLAPQRSNSLRSNSPLSSRPPLAPQGEMSIAGAHARTVAARRAHVRSVSARTRRTTSPSGFANFASRNLASASSARRPSAQGIGSEFAAAADAIIRCDYLLIAAGAGFSADSGLAVYKDIADVPTYRAAGLTYAELCDPLWLAKDPALFYGFWGSCFNSYMLTSPHAGYGVLARWRDSVVGRGVASRAGGRLRPASGRLAPPSSRAVDDAVCALMRPEGGSKSPGAVTQRAGGPATSDAEDMRDRTFVYTSNVDTAFARAGMGGEAALYEIHGNIRTWQCSRPCERSLAHDGGTWQLSDAHRFEVDLQSMRAPERKRPAEDA